jgi:hypothetical protein
MLISVKRIETVEIGPYLLTFRMKNMRAVEMTFDTGWGIKNRMTVSPCVAPLFDKHHTLSQVRGYALCKGGSGEPCAYDEITRMLQFHKTSLLENEQNPFLG